MENNVFKDWIEKTSGGSEYATFFNMLKIYMSKTDTQAGYDITGVPVYVSDVTFEDNTFTFTFSDGSVLVGKVEASGSIDAYTKSESDTKFSLKTEVYTKSEVDSKIPTQIEIVNNLTSGGAGKALSAEQGKQLNSSINSKVDKVVGKSLISDSEITRLASVTNYDDTDLAAELNKKANTDNVYSKTDIDGKLIVATTSKNGLMSSSDKTKLNGIDLSNYVSLSTYNSKVSELESTISELTARLEALESK